MDHVPALRRRHVLGIVTSSLVVGCTTPSPATGSDPPVHSDVVAGPDDSFVFEPAELTVQVGETVTWYFASPSHNVSCRPGDSPTVKLPDGATPFATYGPSESPRSTLPEHATFSHTFEVPGEYVYVCIPHVSFDMIGSIHVTV